MQALLQSFNAHFSQCSPFLVVTNYGGLYYRNQAADYTVEYDHGDEGLSPNAPQTGVLKTQRILVLNGGTTQTLDRNHLQPQMQSIMTFCLGAVAHHLRAEAMQSQNMLKKPFVVATFDQDLTNQSVYGTEDTRILSTLTRFSKFRQQVARGLITPLPNSKLISTRNLYDQTYLATLARGNFVEIITFKYETSLVISKPTFTLVNNALYFEFKYALQDGTQLIAHI